MRARLLGFLYALAGIALAFALTFGAYVLAGDELERTPRAVAVRNELAPRPTPTPDDRGDISGPCDEAEHADDPRCAPGGEDHPSNDDDDSDDDDDDNSGRGSGDDDDNSGRGSHDHDDDDSGSDDDDSGSDDDNSGSGSDDDNSGSGSDDSGGDD